MNMRAVVDGKLPAGVTVKDIIQRSSAKSARGGTGYALECAGEAGLIDLDGRAYDYLRHVRRGRRQSRLHRPLTKSAYTYLKKTKPKAPKVHAWDEAMRCCAAVILR